MQLYAKVCTIWIRTWPRRAKALSNFCLLCNLKFTITMVPCLLRKIALSQPCFLHNDLPRVTMGRHQVRVQGIYFNCSSLCLSKCSGLCRRLEAHRVVVLGGGLDSCALACHLGPILLMDRAPAQQVSLGSSVKIDTLEYGKVNSCTTNSKHL